MGEGIGRGDVANDAGVEKVDGVDAEVAEDVVVADGEDDAEQDAVDNGEDDAHVELEGGDDVNEGLITRRRTKRQGRAGKITLAEHNDRVAVLLQRIDVMVAEVRTSVLHVCNN